MPSGLLPSRSVGPEPGMMTIVALGRPAGMSRVPLSGASGPGASIGAAAGAPTAMAAAASREAMMLMIGPLIRYLGKSRIRGFSSTPRGREQTIDHAGIAAAEQAQVQQGREQLVERAPPRPVRCRPAIGFPES